MNETTRQEIKDIITQRYGEDRGELCKDIMEGYVFGTYASNEHYTVDEIAAIYDEVELEKDPPVIKEVVEEPIIEELMTEEPVVE